MLLSLSIIGLILSVILLYFNVRNYKSTIYLGLFFFLISLYSFTQYVLVYSKSVYLVSIFLVNIPILGSLMYLIGPTLYWYIRSVLTDDFLLKKKDLWHLMPMLVYFIFVLPYMFTSFSYKTQVANLIVNDYGVLQQYKYTLSSELFSVQVMHLSWPILVLGYTLWSIGLFIRYLNFRGELLTFSRQQFMTKWLSVLMGFQFLLIACHFLNMQHPFSGTLNVLQFFSGIGLMGLLISPFFFPKILYGLPQFPAPTSTLQTEEIESDPLPDDSRKKTNHLEAEYLHTIHQKAEYCMKEDQPYLQTDFSLAQFSVLIQVPVHHLCYFFREEKKQHFNDYRNGWRINHAKTLILEGKAKVLTLETIGFLSGFSSRNTFLTTFKKVEGITPSTFAAQMKN